MWKLREKDEDKEQQLLEQGQDKLVARLVSQREGIEACNVSNFIATYYNDLSHPHSLNGVKEAADIFCQAVKEKKSIAVFGDYDCDGIFSSVMLHELCENLDHECKVFLPSRMEHGYGLNDIGIQAFKDYVEEPPYLFIATDCGSNNEKQIKDLKDWGVEKVIIIDHHLVDEETKSVSSDVLINWHLSEDTNELCACGEVFQFIRGIRWLTKKVNPLEYVTYAAIGTVADVSPLTGDNRIIVRHGLNEFAISHIVASGLHALIHKCYIRDKTLTVEDIAFKIAPRINAAGRIASPKKAYHLLVEKNVEIAEIIATELNDLNNERKDMQREAARQASEMVKNNPEAYKNGILVCDPDWHIGMVGIVASRLVDEFQVPAIVIGKEGNRYKGSGRSLEGINLKKILDGCSQLFETYGGHHLAAGVTLKEECKGYANKVFNEACADYFKETEVSPSGNSYYDASLKVNKVSVDLAQKLLSSMYPYCKLTNPEPVFKISDVRIDGTDIKEGNGWTLVKLHVKKEDVKIPYQFKMFSDKFGTDINGRHADVYFSFPQNFNTNRPETFQLNLLDIDLK